MARTPVTAATGRAGSALVPRLPAARHDVVAVTDRRDGVETLEWRGATAALADPREPGALPVRRRPSTAFAWRRRTIRARTGSKTD